MNVLISIVALLSTPGPRAHAAEAGPNVAIFQKYHRAKVEIDRAIAVIEREQPKFLEAVRTADFATWSQTRLDAFGKAWSALLRVQRTLVAADTKWSRDFETRGYQLLEQVEREFLARRIAPTLRACQKYLSLEPL